MDTAIKICGLVHPEHAIAAVDAGADMLGLMFAPSRRQLRPEQAADLAKAVRAYEDNAGSIKQVRLVGVFVNEDVDRIATIAHWCCLDAIQLSGDEDVSILDSLPPQYTIVKAIRLIDTAVEHHWLATNRPVQFLVDAHVVGSYGGTGVVADWEQAAQLAQQHEIILAGGLTSANVGNAVQSVRPWGVDVSSGVESNGTKDTAKIRAFVTAVRTMSELI